MTVLLALDTAIGPCSVALWQHDRVTVFLTHDTPSQQSARLMPMAEEALRQAGLRYCDLDRVAATVGPGSFTGIRTGLAAAQGIAFAAGIASLGFTTLDVLAYAARSHLTSQRQSLYAMLNAGKGEYYYRCYNQNLEPATAPALATPDQLAHRIGSDTVLLCGNAALKTPGAIHSGIVLPQAGALAELAARHALFPGLEPQALTPYYIRAPDAKLPAVK